MSLQYYISRTLNFMWGTPASELRHLCSAYSQFSDFGFFIKEDPLYQSPARKEARMTRVNMDTPFAYIGEAEFVSLF